MSCVPVPTHNIKESIGHEGRGTTSVIALDLGGGDCNHSLPLAKLIDDLGKVLADIPEKYRSTATLNIRASGEYASGYADVTWERPESDAELADRRRWLKSLDDEDERRDIREYERLKAKFGDR